MAYSSAIQQQQQQLQLQKTSLYVGDLDPQVKAADLYQAFSEIGTVISARVCRDSLSGNSLGYGYVNFSTPLEAVKGLHSMNHKILKGKPMRIMWCERNPSARKSNTANLFVKNLDPSIDSARLESIFGKFGDVISCKVAEDENGKRKGFGFVQFDKEESAMAALNGLHDTLLEGKKLYVGKFIKSSQRNQTFTNLYVKNLNKDLTDDGLKAEFSWFGKVTSAVIMRDSLGKSKGFGFVSFESPEEAKHAVEALNNASRLGGESKLFVGRAQKKAEREKMIKESIEKLKASTVYVANLHPSVDEESLKSHFGSSGLMVASAKVVRHENGTSKGFGFVIFSNPTGAMYAKAVFHGSVLRGKHLQVGLARSTDVQRNHSLPKEQFGCYPYYPAPKSASSTSSMKSSMNQICNNWSFPESYDPYPHREQDFRSNKCLNLNSATGNPISISTNSSFTASSNQPCKMNMSLEQKAQVVKLELPGIELKRKDDILEFVKDAIQFYADTRGGTRTAVHQFYAETRGVTQTATASYY